MSSVFHAFMSGNGERCCWPMPDGSSCGRLGGSHKKDERAGRVRRRTDTRKGRPDRHERILKKDRPFIFFDTEGIGEGADHAIVYGAAVDEHGATILEVSRADFVQPGPEVWLDALLDIGRITKQTSVFAYGFGYDRTKMLQGLPAETLYLLTHRGERPPSKNNPQIPAPLFWRDYMLDLQGTRFSVAKPRRDEMGRRIRSKSGKLTYDRMCVWDVLKFFQSPFVDALEAWKRTEKNPGSVLDVPDADLDHMRKMKGMRAAFTRDTWEEVKLYCRNECKYGAQLVRELTQACERIGVNLRRYDGAGSISHELMKLHRVNEFMSAKNARSSLDRPALKIAIMSAFAGGRFETAYCGIIRKKIFSRDICSAYPYAMYFLPCLACGMWRKVVGDSGKVHRAIERASLACVRVVSEGRNGDQVYGSFAHRDPLGNITFPIANRTWAWKPEFLAARDDMQDRVTVREAWLYETQCDHRPFRFMPELYLERLRVGKEGRGIAMKLGYNGCAGKTMQRVGSHKWQEYVWAGNTTSTTRAQLLTGISKFRDQWDVAYLATDGILVLKDKNLGAPIETGTKRAKDFGKDPLGAWEVGKPYEQGVCIVRPGIAFPLDATEEQKKEIKARGISKKTLLESTDRVIEAMRAAEIGKATEVGISRRIFAGMKMSVSKQGKPGAETYKASERYGTWHEQEIQVRFAAQPKRFARLPGEEGMLLPWMSKERESLPYGMTPKSAEAIALEAMQDALLEQPNLDGVEEYGGEL